MRKGRREPFIDGRSLCKFCYLPPSKLGQIGIVPGKDEKGEVPLLKDLMVKGGEHVAVQSGEGSKYGSFLRDLGIKPPVYL